MTDLGQHGDERPSQGGELGRLLSEKLESIELNILDHIRATLNRARELMSCSECGLLVPAEDESQLRFLVSANSQSGISDVVEALRIPLDTSLAGYVFSTCQPISVSNPEDYYAGVDEKTGLETRFYLAAPIIDGENVIGVLTCVNRPTDHDQVPFDGEEIVRSGQIARVLACGIRFYRRYLLNMGLLSDDLQFNSGFADGAMPYSFDDGVMNESSALARAVNDLERLSTNGQELAAGLINVIANHERPAESY